MLASITLASMKRETYESILALRVVRSFTDEPVAGDDLDAVLEAGRWTGSSKNTQGWRFAVIDDEEMRLRLAEAGVFSQPMRNAPVAIGLISTPDGDGFDIGRLAQNMMLAAAARGLGSCPVTLQHTEAAARVLGLPDGYECGFAVVLGHTDEAAEASHRAARRPAMAGRLPMSDLLWEIPGG
jgi:nitroreductase